MFQSVLLSTVVTVTDITTLISSVPVSETPSTVVSTCTSVPTNNTISEEQAELVAEEIVKNLTVDSKSTNAYKNSKISKGDSRTSAKTMGCVGILFVVIPFAVLVIADFKKIFGDFMLYENIFQK